jgi:butyrate kinase
MTFATYQEAMNERTMRQEAEIERLETINYLLKLAAVFVTCMGLLSGVVAGWSKVTEYNAHRVEIGQ